ncbi:MAG TPA: formylglycine-generating enzyme family protein [Thermotogota bacterium]|jgi:formylglycine-generating enzyme required for sulfatase activity|nr:formylglycine-generating enzyme family protein [Thermotogota bacterium]NLH18916.1 formylglycine-generating enzyme family protein [Thermotogaceae bacterium]OQC32397.1 MAG: Serine/threonine-protein kinase pkn1 [Thermotogota bacterium ADurb.Bin062]HNY81625.1 formylglycine-generating enzyme family protein [Thermotogota bacterium]HOD90423.1 formylglycine-generating enzyme family protein [Thermotogota bacterium]
MKRKKRKRLAINEETLWIPWNGEGERQLTFNETQWIIGKIVEERGSADPEECRRQLLEAKGKLQTILSFTSVLVKVKGGSFQMGNVENDSEEYSEEKPVHTVTLTYDYWIGKYEVTFNECDAYCASTGKSKPSDEEWGRGTRPVMNVSWFDAIGYCNWLSEREGIKKAYDSQGNLLDKSGKVTTDITNVEGHRLPTEAEWEYAARGGQNSRGYKYAGSNDLNEVGWYDGNSDEKTHPVGEKKPNELGLYDMSGNVWEWCHDWYGNYRSAAQTNPTGPSSGAFGAYRVIRGGSWKHNAQYCRAAGRYYYTPTYSYYYLGFRLSRTVF